MPNLSYTASDFPFTPFTKMLSNSVNTCFIDIRTLLNTTKLDDTNLQDAGITRATKLKAGTAKALVVNHNTTGVMSELTSVTNGAVYFNASGNPTAAALPLLSGGTGASLVVGNEDEVLGVTGGAIVFKVSPTPPPIKIFSYNNFT